MIRCLTSGTLKRRSGDAENRQKGAESGSATVLAVGIIGALLGLAAAGIAVAGAAVAQQRAANAADAAALTAADVASGRLPGVPCTEADDVAQANGSRVSSCRLDGLIVTIVVESDYLGFTVTAEARAGPPGTAQPKTASR
ncbi:Rv3654c family TadE-like protein [Leifsonia poae]|uniref:Rv3654c family TadE-like protein n=1 Tax=Leifsonia poae TaxID=110933 RepID=UPI001CBCA7D4|nr:Rv3654c family TadE-like protein [Leifsonia poae]